MPYARFNAAIGLAVGVGALILQFALTVGPTFGSANVLLALVLFFTFVTILANLALVLTYLSALAPHLPLSLFRHPVTRATMVAVMGGITIFYHFLLADRSGAGELFLIAEQLLGYATTLIYCIWWLRFVPHGLLSWRNMPLMLLPALAYCLSILVGDALLGEFPAFTLGAGLPAVFLNTVIAAVGLAGLSAIAIAVDKLLARHTRTAIA